MALVIGDEQASAGMSKAIFDELDAVLSPAIPDDSLAKARDAWKQLAFAIAKGVITHIVASIEIKGVQVSGTISTAVTASVTGGNNVSGTASGPVTIPQAAPFTGHVA